MSLDPGFSTDSSRQIFGGRSRVRHMLEVESALAAAQAEVGVIPLAAAEAIAEVCEVVEIDADDLAIATWERGSPLIPLIDQIRDRLSALHRNHVHFGATTQDVIDTVMVLQIKAGLAAIESEWLDVGSGLADLADRYRSAPMIGRSFLQAGAPITFGRKVAGWLCAVTGDLSRVRSLIAGLPAQLGGPMGVLAAMNPHGLLVAEGFAARLGLVAANLPWHTDRWPIRSAAGVVAEVAATARQIAVDTILLAQTGVEEVAVRPGGSSSLADKRNPIDAIGANAAAQFCLTQASGLLAIGPYEHERSTGAWHAEWALVPLLFHGVLAAIEAVGRSLNSMQCDIERMAANLAAAGIDESEVGMSDAMVDRAIAAFAEIGR